MKSLRSRAVVLLCFGLMSIGSMGAVATASASPSCANVDASIAPCLTFAPSTVHVGSQVEFSGRITKDMPVFEDKFRQRSVGVTLIGGAPGCLIQADTVTTSLHLSPSGDVSGAFVVPAAGDCTMSVGSHALSAGTYEVAMGCVTCNVGNIQVTGAATTLPFTGAPTWWLVLAAIAALVAGTALLRGHRSPTGS